jgi:VWFA-related protein
VRPRFGTSQVLAGVLAVGLALASAPVLPQALPRFGAEAEMVTVDVVVLGPDGKPVPGLKREDFRVFEDGRPQTVTAFEAVEAAVPALVAPETTTSRPSVARVATNVAGPPTRRTFAIVFDDMHVGDVNIELAKRAVETFVARDTAPGDRLVLVTVSDGRYWATNRGGDDAAWREALKGVMSHRPLQGRVECRVTYYEAMQADAMGNGRVAELVKRRWLALCAPPTMRPSPEELAGNVPSERRSAPSDAALRLMPSMPEEYARQRGQLAGSLRVVREIIFRLGATPGRKSLVLVTEGFPVDPSLDVFREVREQAARANVAIHFLDARGLATGPEFLSAAGASGIIPGPDIGPTLALWRLEDGGAKALAEETGGRVLQTNDLVAGLVQVAEESRVTYLLGYEPTNTKRDGRYRKLKVEVLRPGLEVRARAGYFAGRKAKKKAEPEPTVVDRVLGNPFDADGIPLRLAAYVMGPAPLQGPVPKTGVEVLVAGEVRLDAFERQVKAGRVVAAPRLRLFVSSRARETHEAEWTLEVSLTPAVEAAEPGETWHPFLTRIAMEPGDHRARLVVESGGKVGSVTTDFVVPGFTEERLSTPILSDQLVVGPGARRVMPVVRRSFPASSTLQVWVELHGAAVGADTNQPRATAAFVARSADGREWARGGAVPMSLESGKPTRLVSLPLTEAPPGENEVVLTVRDEVWGRTFEAREPFRVEPFLGVESRPGAQ